MRLRVNNGSMNTKVNAGKRFSRLGWWVALAAIAMLSVAGSACSGNGAPAGGVMKVIVTSYSLQYFAQRIGGDAVSVVNLVPPGVEAHDYEPNSGDLRTLGAAGIVVYNGGGFDPWVDRALATKKASQVVVMALQAAEGKTAYATAHPEDPHIWLDPVLAVEEVRLISDAMEQARSAEAAQFKANGDALIADLQALDERIRAGLASCKQRTLAVSHEAFGHFAARYNLEQVALAGISPDAEPSPGDLADITEKLRALGARYVLTEPIVSPQLAQTIAKEIGAELLPFHPLESLTPDEVQRGETYFTIMDTNLQNLRKALECG